MQELKNVLVTLCQVLGLFRNGVQSSHENVSFRVKREFNLYSDDHLRLLIASLWLCGKLSGCIRLKKGGKKSSRNSQVLVYLQARDVFVDTSHKILF